MALEIYRHCGWGTEVQCGYNMTVQIKTRLAIQNNNGLLQSKKNDEQKLQRTMLLFSWFFSCL